MGASIHPIFEQMSLRAMEPGKSLEEGEELELAQFLM